MEVITKKEAKEQGLKFYFTGIPCSKGHTANRLVSNSSCTACRQTAVYREYKRKSESERYHSNIEQMKIKKREYYVRKGKEVKKIYDQLNAEKISEKRKERYYLRQEIELELKRQWCANNKDRANFHKANYRASKLNATPKWLTKEDKEKISWFYKEASRLTKETGIAYHVDHIHPLKGKNFCGLNIPYNLQILTAKENLSKKNKLIQGLI